MCECLPCSSKEQEDLHGAGKCQSFFHTAQMNLSQGSDSPVLGFPTWPLLSHEWGQQGGHASLWLVQCQGWEMGRNELHPSLGWEAKLLLFSLQTQ